MERATDSRPHSSWLWAIILVGGSANDIPVRKPRTKKHILLYFFFDVLFCASVFFHTRFLSFICLRSYIHPLDLHLITHTLNTTPLTHLLTTIPCDTPHEHTMWTHPLLTNTPSQYSTLWHTFHEHTLFSHQHPLTHPLHPTLQGVNWQWRGWVWTSDTVPWISTGGERDTGPYPSWVRGRWS